MKNMRELSKLRNRERGAVANIVAFAWTALFGMAVLAIDFGYLYTKRRGVQAVADAAVRAAMPTFANNGSSGLSLATPKARNVVNYNGYVDGTAATTVVIDNGNPADVDTFRVKITRDYPTFIGGIFGMSGKSVSGVAVGRRAGGGGG